MATTATAPPIRPSVAAKTAARKQDPAVETQPTKEPVLEPAEFAAWMQQLCIVFCGCSGVLALIAARVAERPWLSAVFSAFVAATITGFAGTTLAKALQHLCISDAQSKKQL